MSHQFTKNLLQLSNSQTIGDAITEWVIVQEEHLDEQTGQCICNHLIKHMYYLYNATTGRMITVGIGCCKKFKHKLKEMGNTLLSDVLKKHIQKGKYDEITDVYEYSDSIKESLKVSIKEKYEHVSFWYHNLIDLSNEVKQLIDEYKLAYLQDEYDYINKRLAVLTEQYNKRKKQEHDEWLLREALKRHEEAERIKRDENDRKKQEEDERKRQEDYEKRKQELVKKKEKEADEKRIRDKLKKEYKPELSEFEYLKLLQKNRSEKYDEKGLKSCCRCKKPLNDVKFVTYSEEQTKSKQLFACSLCNSFIQDRLSLGFGRSSFLYY